MSSVNFRFTQPLVCVRKNADDAGASQKLTDPNDLEVPHALRAGGSSTLCELKVHRGCVN
jgi:hypothetical protein